jgi:transposase-like protein
VRLAGQQIGIEVPRVRGPRGEVSLTSYESFGRDGDLNETLFRRVLYGISCRDYETAAEAVPGAIGLSSSTVSRQFVAASARRLQELMARDLTDLDIVALFMDGKTFAADELVLALGVTMDGRKVVLGFVQTATENARTLKAFLGELQSRGLSVAQGVLVVIDGSKGLSAAVKDAFKGLAVVQRCQWHKRENVVGYLPKGEQASWRRRLQLAYQRPTYAEAKRELLKLERELEKINQSAAASLREGLEETLTLHRLGVYARLGLSFKTTNCIESINSMAERRCGKVKAWKNSSQKQRWFAAALLDIEPRLRRVRGYRELPCLREALMKDLEITSRAEMVA